MGELSNESVALTVTSPPYPMIEMWDGIFENQNKLIGTCLSNNEGDAAFELMHQEMDKVWDELWRVTRPGGIVCINIGDATRTINGEFKLYANHSRILSHCVNIGFSNLPNILWKKQTNAPNKFMGSGMLPGGAYVTLEHEHILIFRKGRKREFVTAEDKHNRQETAFFWEERNKWFSDTWDLKGAKQKMEDGGSRNRSGAFPFELAYRLINMYSVKGDTVLDPFLGTGTTTFAAIASGRNSVGYEIDTALSETVSSFFDDKLLENLNNYTRRRILNHLDFVSERIAKKGEEAFKHENVGYDFPVMTKQEREIIINFLSSIEKIDDNLIQANYITEPVMDTFRKESLFAKAS
ncbi:MAG: site-specific DNA-methyltransferase [Flavobacteriales bacterium]|nr:site-specific DNA-methyltransferase [Flavobacteriales bacterium]